jgi:dienelactone hydrolase
VRLLQLLLMVGLGLAVAAWFVFVPRRPAPSGPRAVGQLEFVLKDSRGQPLPVTIWYPAASSAANSPLESPKPAPVILYSPGWAGTRTQSSIQVENLASHGFVVVGCNDISTDASFDTSSDAAAAATVERAGRDIVVQAGRLVEILHALASTPPPLLAGRVDLARVGVLGYSLGGPSGLTAALQDPRVVAVFSLDGGLFGPPAAEIGSAAYFLLSANDAFPSEAELASPVPAIRNYALISAIDIPRNKLRMERPNNYWAQIPAADHADLSDALFAPSHAKLFRTNFQRSAMNAAIEAYEVAFFRSLLMGDSAPLLALVGKSDQTARWISSTSTPAGATKARQ